MIEAHPPIFERRAIFGPHLPMISTVERVFLLLLFTFYCLKSHFYSLDAFYEWTIEFYCSELWLFLLLSCSEIFIEFSSSPTSFVDEQYVIFCHFIRSEYDFLSVLLLEYQNDHVDLLLCDGFVIGFTGREKSKDTSTRNASNSMYTLTRWNQSRINWTKPQMK